LFLFTIFLLLSFGKLFKKFCKLKAFSNASGVTFPKMDFARADRKNWVEPLREWILDIKKATQLVSSDNFFEIKDYFKKIGTNPVLREKSVSISFCPPTEFAFACKTGAEFAHPLAILARKRATIFSGNFPECGVMLSFARTYYENQMN
jgi:hypothetical protein